MKLLNKTIKETEIISTDEIESCDRFKTILVTACSTWFEFEDGGSVYIEHNFEARRPFDDEEDYVGKWEFEFSADKIEVLKPDQVTEIELNEREKRSVEVFTEKILIDKIDELC